MVHVGTVTGAKLKWFTAGHPLHPLTLRPLREFVLSQSVSAHAPHVGKPYLFVLSAQETVGKGTGPFCTFCFFWVRQMEVKY